MGKSLGAAKAVDTLNVDWLIKQEKEIKAILSHLGCNSRLYFIAYILLLFIVGLWPFNFNQHNEAQINSEGGLVLSRPGSVYTPAPSEKLHNLNQFTIYIDVVTSSDGLNSFAKILSYAFNQQNANFIVGQWKDGLGLHLRSDGRAQEIHFGEFGVLRINERVRSAISVNGQVLQLFVNGENRVEENRGPLTFKRWIDTYPLVIGTDAVGASQWKGTIYEASIYDRSLSPAEVARLSDPNGRKGTRENPPVSPFAKGGESDGMPLIHYVFRPENTYETVFRGKRALGVRDLGKGKPADLVIPEYFEPYERVFLGWEDNWMQYKSNWLDMAVNILGFVPFGVLLVFASRAKKCLSVLVPECLSEEGKKPTAYSQQPTGTRQENPPVSPFTKGGGLVVAVVLVVAVGVVVSFAIEYLQAYLPSRDSSIRDLVTNTLGTAMGAVAAALLLRSRIAATTVDKLTS